MMRRGLANTHVSDCLRGAAQYVQKLGGSGRVKHNIAQDRGGLVAACLSFSLALFLVILWLWVLSGWPRLCRLQMDVPCSLRKAEAARNIWMQGISCD